MAHHVRDHHQGSFQHGWWLRNTSDHQPVWTQVLLLAMHNHRYFNPPPIPAGPLIISGQHPGHLLICILLKTVLEVLLKFKFCIDISILRVSCVQLICIHVQLICIHDCIDNPAPRIAREFRHILLCACAYTS